MGDEMISAKEKGRHIREDDAPAFIWSRCAQSVDLPALLVYSALSYHTQMHLYQTVSSELIMAKEVMAYVNERHAPIQFLCPRCDSVLVGQREKDSLGDAALICRHDCLVNALDKATLTSVKS